MKSIYNLSGDATHTELYGIYRWGFFSYDVPNGQYYVQLSPRGLELIRMLSVEQWPTHNCTCVVDNFGNLVKVN